MAGAGACEGCPPGLPGIESRANRYLRYPQVCRRCCGGTGSALQINALRVPGKLLKPQYLQAVHPSRNESEHPCDT